MNIIKLVARFRIIIFMLDKKIIISAFTATFDQIYEWHLFYNRYVANMNLLY